MDYDDNEFQSQNFQLVGEDSSRFPPVFHPCPFPKYDLDEHLHDHLRFDSLVESDIFLGIQGQVENHWIGDFSTGSSVIEFGSSAAESCSISRHDNVWSEATSSESVEMLLKSVEQAERIEEQPPIEEANTCHGLVNIASQMDPRASLDSSLNPEIDVVYASSSLLDDNHAQSMPMLNKDVTGNLSPVEDVTRNFDDNNSGCGSPVVVDMSPVGQNLTVHQEPAHDCSLENTIDPCHVGSSEENMTKNEKCQGEVHSSDDGSKEKGDQDNPGSTEIEMYGQTHDSSPSTITMGLVVDVAMLNNQNLMECGTGRCSEVVSCKVPGSLLNEAVQKVESGILVEDEQKIGWEPEGDLIGIKANVVQNSSTTSNVVSLKDSSRESFQARKPDGLPGADVNQVCNVVSTKATEREDSVIESIQGSTEDTGTPSISLLKTESIGQISGGDENTKDKIPAECKNQTDDVVMVDRVEQLETETSSVVLQARQNIEGQYIGSSNYNNLVLEDSSIRTSAIQVAEDNDICDGNVGNYKDNVNVTENATPQCASNAHVPSEAEVDEVPLDVSDVEKASEILQLKTDSHSASQCQINDTKIAAGHASPAEHVINHQPVSTGAAPENAIEFFSGNKSRDVHPLASEDRPVLKEVVEQKEMASSSLAVSGFDHSDKEGEVQQDDGFLKAASGLTRGSYREHCLAAAPVEMDSVEKNVDPRHLNELQASVDAAISNVSDRKLERISSSVSSVIEKKIDFASESILHGKFEDVVSLGTGDAANSDLEKAPSYTTNNVKSISVETGHSCPNTFETKCGPSDVIGSDHSSRNKHIENNENSFDQNCAASDGVPCIPYEHGRNPGSTDAADNDPKKLNVSKDGGSSFEVRSIENPPENDDGKRWEPSCSAQPAEMAQVKERRPATTDMPQPTNVKLKETARGNQLASDEEKPQGDASMDIDEARKTVSLSGSSSEKVSATKDKPVRESSRSKHLVGKEDNSCSTSTNSVRCIARDTKIEGVSRYAYHEDSVKSSCAPLIQASTLPDLNSSFSAATLFRQPFTDLQQVQLRAQIIVYGSLIQGVPPDEACMISAFGGTDGGRGTWESAWRAAAERFHNQRSPLSNFETPVLLHSGIRITEQTSRSSPIHSKSHVSPACRAGTKISPLTTLNPAVSLQSPLWNITTPLHDGLHSSMPRGPLQDSHRAISAFPSYQSPQVRPYVGSGGPWPSQSPASGTWAIPQTSAVDASGQFAALPILETVQGTPIHDSSIPFASNMQVVSPNVYPSAASVSFSSVSAAHSEAKVVSVTAGKHLPGESKSRKRKKSMASGVTQILSASQTQAEPPAIGVTVHLPSSSPLSTANQSDKPICGLAAISSPVISSANCQVIGRGDAGDGLSDETCSKLEQAKQNAINAAALAASAVRHSQDVWNKLANHNNSNSVPELEAKIVSAAAAIGAAASVAKAAAAAAKVACDAALQAKMMADEALGVIKVGHTTQNVEASVSDGGRNLGRVSPASILKGKEKMNGSSSVLVTALETSRKRVEETSAATKRAENLAAVMRAAELAADAVSQAGAVVAMGDPVPLSSSDLVEAGVDGYWKLLKLTGDSKVKTNNIPIRQPQPDASGSFEGNDENHNKRHSNEKEVRPPSTSTNEKELGYKGRKLSRMSKPAEVVSGMVIGSGNELRRDQSEDILNGSSIKEGSSVEVLSGGIWYSARVLNLKGGMVYVCYAEHGTDEGSGQLKEWLPLRDDKAPRVRIAHPVHASKYEGTRKRKKTDVWNVGDQVDVWTGFGWRGGVVKEKSKIDETLLTVYFPVGEDLSTVREWDLRASLIWKDGEWMEWSRLRDYKSVPNQGDTPTAKHHKLDRPEHGFAFQSETGEKVFSKHSVIEGLKKPEEVKPLPLSEKDRLFSLGKDVKGDNNSDALRMKRTGLQKAGSGVIFGIPKPGKKRKFMDVSKHYNSNGASKVKENSDHDKTEKHMMSQATRGWKPPPKPDPKRKQAGEAKSKMMKPGKSQSIQNTADKGSSSVSEGTIHDALPNVQILGGNEENRLEKHKQTETGSVSDSRGTAGERETSSLQSAVKEASSSRRKPVLAGGLPLGPKAKIGTGAENAGRGVVKDPDSTENRPNSALEPIEPRRSNRRIQPTPKFLEGLQSSLIITKIPSISHDRTTKSLRRSTASSRSRRQG